MNQIRTTLATLLAILWLPVSSHCLLFESTTGFDSLSCCQHTVAPGDPAHHDDECATDSCSIVEEAQYKSSVQRMTIPPFIAQISLDPPALLATAASPSCISAQPRAADALSSLPVTWQFSARAALPVRAPSLVS